MCALIDDVESLCLVKECRELEESFGAHFTDELLSGAEQVGMRDVRGTLRDMDREGMLGRCVEKCGLIAEVAREVTWSRLWDDVMDLGSWQVRELQNISRMLSAHERGSKPCPRCEVEDLDGSLLDHLVERHKEELRLGDVDGKTGDREPEGLEFKLSK